MNRTKTRKRDRDVLNEFKPETTVSHTINKSQIGLNFEGGWRDRESVQGHYVLKDFQVARSDLPESGGTPGSGILWTLSMLALLAMSVIVGVSVESSTFGYSAMYGYPTSVTVPTSTSIAIIIASGIRYYLLARSVRNTVSGPMQSTKYVIPTWSTFRFGFGNEGISFEGTGMLQAVEWTNMVHFTVGDGAESLEILIRDHDGAAFLVLPRRFFSDRADVGWQGLLDLLEKEQGLERHGD